MRPTSQKSHDMICLHSPFFNLSPTTVLEAVRNASGKVDDLMELANEKYASDIWISDEIDRIREGLHNVKVLSLTADGLLGFDRGFERITERWGSTSYCANKI